MAEQPLVSVVIPAYNAASHIRATVLSARRQTYPNVEIIVVDDGSKDETARLVESIASDDSRVTLLRQENKGVGAARNRAIADARGEFIAPLDADDIWYPEKLQRQMECMLQAGASVGLVYAWWVSIDEDGTIQGAAHRWNAEGDVLEALVYRNFIGNASNPLLRRACIERVGCYNTELYRRGGQGCEDWELALRVAEEYEFRLVPYYLVGYRGVRNSMSTEVSSMEKSYELVLRNVKARHPEIDNKIFRWSRSEFNQYLAGMSYSSGNFRDTFRRLLRVLALDPAAATAPWVLKTVVKSFIRMSGAPLTRCIWPDHDDWLRFKERFGQTSRPALTLDEVSNHSNSRTHPWSWRSWKPFDYLRFRRWRQVAQEARPRVSPPAPGYNGSWSVPRNIHD